MKIGKIVLGGVAVTVANMILGMVTCAGMFSWVYKVEPTNVWKPMTGGPGAAFMISSLVLNIVFVAIYALLKNSLPGKNKIVKGLGFGLVVWAVGMLPGMLATYAFMTVAPVVVIYWTLLGLVEKPLYGMIAALIYGE